MVKKRVDSRVRTLIENGVRLGQRSLFVIVGDHGRDQVVNLHYILSKSSVKARPSVLWCYKKELGFTSHRQKRMRKIQKEIARGLRQADEQSPFELFIASTDIRYAYYKETDKILGNTYGMCVLQDFPSLTPNLLARTIETVQGGGIIVILLKSMTSLKQLFALSMDVHARFRTEAHQDISGRFNERFLLSLGGNPNCLVVDDELNILPISSHVRMIQKVQAIVEVGEDGAVFQSANERELSELKGAMRETQPVGALIDATRTLDQAKAVLTFVEAISEKTLRSTVVLTAARGRGKSAALGLSIAGAVAYGYSNIFVTAPSPENLKTLFEMIFKGFDQLEYKEHSDYEIIQSTDPELNKAVVRVNIFHSHRQTIQYIAPQDANRLGQAELLVIDEAAAIPLPMVKALLGPYLVFMSSTVNGYEGTGRSLSLKLVKQLRQQSAAPATSSSSSSGSSSSRVLREVTLDEPIRYSLGDPVESWLNDLLCLNCTNNVPKLHAGVPHPSQCDLYYVERDTLFSYHRASEEFLQRMMALYVSSHYKNSPNDLQLLSDAPAHQLFVLLGPASDRAEGHLPDILCVVQVCLEGAISRESAARSLASGARANGDLIPWTVAQQFQNNEFPSLSGARIVRIATHPEAVRMGYASRAIQLLTEYYEGKLTNLEEVEQEASSTIADHSAVNPEASNLLTEIVGPRRGLPPLLSALSDRRPELLHYIGVSYGLTQELFNFWRKANFYPLYLRLTPNPLTGEHTCIMIRTLQSERLASLINPNWLDAFYHDFRQRFISLLGFQFGSFSSALALSLLVDSQAARQLIANANEENQEEKIEAHFQSASASAVEQWKNPSASSSVIAFPELAQHLSEFDLRRLESYANNLVDYHLVLDLVPSIARLFFLHKFSLTLTAAQAAILLALGLQHKSVEQLERELGLQGQQIQAQFNKIVRKVSTFLRKLEESSIKRELIQQQNEAVAKSKAAPSSAAKSSANKPLNKSLNAELGESAREATKSMLANLNLQQFEIRTSEAEWEKELATKAGEAPTQLSVRSDRDRNAGRIDPHQAKAEKREREREAEKKKKKQKQ